MYNAKYDYDMVFSNKIWQNAKSEEIHQKDQVLELQLRQLDTEQETIVNELESVKKVLDKNIQNVFKTFDGT